MSPIHKRTPRSSSSNKEHTKHTTFQESSRLGMTFTSVNEGHKLSVVPGYLVSVVRRPTDNGVLGPLDGC
jgi:hypothetical protein